MRIVSWNVNGLRAVVKKDFLVSLNAMKPDVFCLQETKAQDDQVMDALADVAGYRLYSNSAVKKGYAGTAVLTKIKPMAISFGLDDTAHDREGRVISLDFRGFSLVTVYTPNSGSELKRLDFRQKWDAAFLAYLKNLEKKKPVIVCGDLNVAHKAIDLARPKANYNKTAGYMQEEIDGMDAIIAGDFIDTFRYKNPEQVRYSWWSYRAGARKKNVGWRLDYFLVSACLADKIKHTDILNEIMGSDHCPVLLDIQFPLS